MIENIVPIIRPDIRKFDLNGVEVTISFSIIKEEEVKEEFKKFILDSIKTDPIAFDGETPLIKSAYAEISFDIAAHSAGATYPNNLMVWIDYSSNRAADDCPNNLVIERPLKSGESFNPYDFIKEDNNDKV